MWHSLHKKKEGVNVASSNNPLFSSSSFPLGLSPKGMRIGEWMVSQRWITPDQLRVALTEQTRRPLRLGELILRLGFISPNQLLKALSALSGLPSISLTRQILDLPTVHQIPLPIAKRHQLILFQQDEKGVHLAMADPEDLLALDKVRLLLGPQTDLIPYHATLDDIAHALDVYYPQPTVDTEEGETVRLVNGLILEAVRLKASDIHLSPTAHSVEVHYRQDGLMHLAHTLHKEKWPAISVRLKIMGSLDIAESRRPQNGRFSLTLGGREIDFRLSCHPTIHGENLVLRILDKTLSLRSLDDLGFIKEDIKTIKRLVQLPQGMIILSGPTGAGKTTTLYALLSHMDALRRNIMTLEEPVEYYLPNIRQTEIREGGPFRFEEGIRSLLRQDPDVIFVSEIRDAETAQMAVRASMTGHLVLGTIHARDNLAVPQRLADLGIPPTVLRGNLMAGITQRLVRQLCEACRYAQVVTSQERKDYSLAKSTTHVYQAKGCEACQQTGYRGREAVAELALFEEAPSTLLTNLDISSLWKRGIEKVLAGKTTFAEIERAIGAKK